MIWSIFYFFLKNFLFTWHFLEIKREGVLNFNLPFPAFFEEYFFILVLIYNIKKLAFEPVK